MGKLYYDVDLINPAISHMERFINFKKDIQSKEKILLIICSLTFFIQIKEIIKYNSFSYRDNYLWYRFLFCLNEDIGIEAGCAIYIDNYTVYNLKG